MGYSLFMYARYHFPGILLTLLLVSTIACGNNEPAEKVVRDTAKPADTAAGDTGTDTGTDTDTGTTSEMSSSTEPGAPTAPETGGDSSSVNAVEACRMTPWGSSCKVDAQIYNLTFEGIDLADNTEKEISFESLRCAGYDSVVMIAGDTRCSACPRWYEEIGKQIDEIHQNRGAVVVSSTDEYGKATLANADAASATASVHADFATGSDPYVFPCRYTFTPFTMVVNLKTAAILGKDTEEKMMSISEVLNHVAAAKQ